MKELERYHPMVVTFFVLLLVGINTLIVHPFFHVVILIFSWCYFLDFKEFRIGKEIRGNGVLMLLTCLSNPIFQQRGTHILLQMNNWTITLEALLYGLDFGCMLAGMINLLKVYTKMIHTSQMLFMLTSISSNAAILFSLSIQELSRIKKQYEDVRTARLLLQPKASWMMRVKENIMIASALITWLMETSIDTSLSMRSRGYGLQKRSQYVKYRLERRDIILLIIEAAMLLVTMYGVQGIRFWWYPTFYQQLDFSHMFLFSLCLLSFAMLPLCLHRKEGILWEDIESI